MKEEQLRKQINDIIEGELQLGINEFLEEKQRKESDQGLGFVTSEEAKKLKVKVFKDEVDKIMKQYKKIKKKETIEEAIEDMPDRIWVPFDELKMYLQQLSSSMMNMVNSIEQSLELIEKNATNRSTIDMYDYINNYGDIPLINAKDRSKK